MDAQNNLVPNMDRRPSVPSTEGSLSPAPSHDNLLSVAAPSSAAYKSASAYSDIERPGSSGLVRSHSGSPLISPSPSFAGFNTASEMGSAGVSHTGTGADAGERDVAAHVSRNGSSYDAYDQTPTQAGPSRWAEQSPHRSALPARTLAYGDPSNATRAPAIPSRHASCELCALVEQCKAHRAASSAAWERRKIKGRDVVYADEQITVYEAQGKERLTRPGKHLVVVINIHAESVYQLGPVDVPLLSHISATARSLCSAGDADGAESGAEDVQVGFVGTVVRDTMSPHAHLHAQAICGPIDSSAPGSTFWRRNVIFAGVNWYSVDDLRAEIREETSNNRIKSGYEHRKDAPIDQVPGAGSIAGPASALEARY